MYFFFLFCTEVLKLGNSNRINERCLELQRNKRDSKAKVCFVQWFWSDSVLVENQLLWYC